MTVLLANSTITLTGGDDALGTFAGVRAIGLILDLSNMTGSDTIEVRFLTDTPIADDVVVDSLTIDHGTTTHPYAWPGTFGSVTSAFIHPRVFPIATSGRIEIEQTAGSSFEVGYQVFAA